MRDAAGIDACGAVTTTSDRSGGLLVVRKTATEPGARRRLSHEAAVLERVRRPGVVDLLDVHDGGATTVLTTAWVGPHSLETCAVQSVEQVAGIMAVLADTVAGLHLAGVVHGRLSPDHVVLDGHGFPVLVGFGGAQLDEAGGPEGTPRTERADDVGALGAMLLELVDRLPHRRGLVRDR